MSTIMPHESVTRKSPPTLRLELLGDLIAEVEKLPEIQVQRPRYIFTEVNGEGKVEWALGIRLRKEGVALRGARPGGQEGPITSHARGAPQRQQARFKLNFTTLGRI
jgi:hypothetical protein